MYELIPHPAYSPDLAPSDFFLFPNLKKDNRLTSFLVRRVEEEFHENDPDFFTSGLIALEHRWSKCIALEGNYIEKKRARYQPEIGLAGNLLTRPRRFS